MSSAFSPSAEQARQFCIMITAGMPSTDAIRYFLPEIETAWGPNEVLSFHDAWMRSAAVKMAMRATMGKTWQEMTLEERIQYGINKHYSELAYFLFSNNYVQLEGASKTKADTCRTALEAKLAGLAGKTDPLTRFWEDFTSGKVKLGAPSEAPVDPLEKATH